MKVNKESFSPSGEKVAEGRMRGQWLQPQKQSEQKQSHNPLTLSPLRIYYHVFSGFVEVPPPWKGEKVADRPDEGVIRRF